MLNVIDELIKEVERKDSAPVVELDPNLDYFPKYFKQNNLIEISKNIYEFNKMVIDIVYDIAVAIKPQLAYDEIFNSYRIKALCGSSH